MIRPNERLAILNRILAMAKKRQTFERVDLVRKHLSGHLTDDWQEVLDSLVSKGKLSIDSYLDHTDKSGRTREVYKLVR